MLSETSLSSAQEEIWLRQPADPAASIHAHSVAFRISGRLEVGALRIAARQLVTRQPALRTAFVPRGDTATQRLVEGAELDVPVHDLGGDHEDGDLDRQVQVRLDAERQRPFDLSAAPLMRCAVLRLAETDWVLLLTAHRIICDSASVATLLRDLAAGYARALGAPARSPRSGGPSAVDRSAA
jgi:NRPS condensation-like uncharacterized protein